MSIARVILNRISEAGYTVASSPPAAEGGVHFVSATNPATGEWWEGTGATLVEAAEDLSERMAQGFSGKKPVETIKQAPRGRSVEISAALVYGIILGIFLVDLFTPGLDAGVFYALPLLIAGSAKMRARSIVGLGALVSVLVFVDYIAEVTSAFSSHPGEPHGLVNRCLTVGALGVLAVWIAGISAGMWSPVKRGSAHRTAVISCQIAILLFAVDISLPDWVNIPILYVIPLAGMVVGLNRREFYAGITVLVVLVGVGYVCSAVTPLAAWELRSVLMNRGMVGLSLVVAAAVLRVLQGRGGLYLRQGVPSE